MNSLDLIASRESAVRSYVRSFPTVFASAKGAWLTDDQGRRYLDFFNGAGTLNYGHNHPAVQAALMEYLQNDGVMHSLDLATTAKVRLLQAIEQRILQPRGLEHKVQFVGPTGTNAVEAAIKLARKATGRAHVIAFSGAYHGHTLGALALTSNRYYHNEHYGARQNVTHLPYDGYWGTFDTTQVLEKTLADPASGVPLPAAVIVEPIQGEGGVWAASPSWLQTIAETCQRHEVLLICDEIQVGNGRTGDYFAFEQSGIQPDIVCVSKSIGGGLPLALNLVHPRWDVWKPGEHTGTFRGNNLAFVAAATLLDQYWADNQLTRSIQSHQQTLFQTLQQLGQRYPQAIAAIRGRGMIWGIETSPPTLAGRISRAAFERGLLMETCGAQDQVVKLLPPLVIAPEELQQGLEMLTQAVADELGPPLADSPPQPPGHHTDLHPGYHTDLHPGQQQPVGRNPSERTEDESSETADPPAATTDGLDLTVDDGAVMMVEEPWLEESIVPLSTDLINTDIVGGDMISDDRGGGV